MNENKNKDLRSKDQRTSARDIIHNQIAELEKGLSTTKYNKSSQGYFGTVKAKIALLRQRLELQKKVSSSNKGDGFAVRKTGDGTVVLLGFPSVGKSTLLNALTNQESKTAAYAFTTVTCIPGLLEYKHTKIQILDVPGIIEGAAAGTGRGKEVLQVIRTSDFVLMVIDVFHPEHHATLVKEVADFGIRLNKKMPHVKITKTSKGGIQVGATVPLTKINAEIIRGICIAFRLMNAEVLIRSDIDEDDFIDVLEGNKVYLNSLVIFNKIDLADEATLMRALSIVQPDLMISAHKKSDIERLKEFLYTKMEFIRIFLKEINNKPDMDVPLVMRKGATIKEICEKLHKDFLTNFKFGRVWGTSAKFPGQKILKTSHVMQDQDILELHLK